MEKMCALDTLVNSLAQNTKAWKYTAFFDLITDLTIKAGSLEESKFLRPEKGDGDIRDDGLNPSALQSLVRPTYSLF